DARRQQGDGGGVFGDSQFTSTLSVNFHFPKIPRRTFFIASPSRRKLLDRGSPCVVFLSDESERKHALGTSKITL
ncbi:hypothetical protein, partial [Aeromonas caviae]|uniref:hypothetical protein n=1 Tax=Aeromonas caviae TaxID=648 RepID=UPI001CC5C32B